MPTTQQLVLSVSDDPDVVRRVVTTCRRRGCRIVSLTYTTSHDDGHGRLSLRLAGDLSQTARLEHWLGNLVDVLAVRGASP